MAKNVFGTGILVMVLVFGMSLVGCDWRSDDENSRIVTGVIVTRIDGTAPNRDSIHITWNSAPGATHYEITYRTNMDSVDTRIPVNSRVTNTTFTHTGFIRNRGPLTYFIRAHGFTTDASGSRTAWVGPWAMSSLVEVRE